MKNKGFITMLMLAGIMGITGCSKGNSSDGTESTSTTTMADEKTTASETEIEDSTYETTVDETTTDNAGKMDKSDQKKWVRDIRNILKPKLEDVAGVTEKLSADKRNEILDDLIADIEAGEVTNLQVIYRLRELISDIGLPYLSMEYTLETIPEDALYVLPILGNWLDDGYYITGCHKDTPEMLGGKLVSVNGVSMEDILDKYDTIVTNGTESGLRSAFQVETQMGMLMMDLDYLGITKEGQMDVPVVVEGSEGTQIATMLTPCYCGDEASAQKYREDLVYWADDFDMIYSDDLYFSNDMAPFIYDMHPESGMVYLQYNESFDSTCGEDFADYPEFMAFFDDMMDEISAHGNIDTIIVDLRRNSGGYARLWDDAAEEYKEQLKDMKFKLLVGRFTQGSVDFIDTTLDMFENVTIYGEETGNPIRNFGYNSAFEMSETGIVIWYPTKEDDVRVLDKIYDDVTKGVIPDVQCGQTYKDLILGIDTVYQMALEK